MPVSIISCQSSNYKLMYYIDIHHDSLMLSALVQGSNYKLHVTSWVCLNS